MARTSQRTSKAKPAKRKAQSPADKSAQRSARAAKVNESARRREAAPILDDGAKRDIAGVACAVLAVALFTVAALPLSGIVTGALAGALHLGLGLGCYILPFVLMLIAASLFYRREGQSVSLRVALGLLLLFLAVLVLLALYTPGVDTANLDDLFRERSLAAQGGYIGAGAAWVLMLLFGRVVSTILMVGLIIISVIVIGFSINGVVERIRARREEALQRRLEYEASLDAYEPLVPDAQPTRRRTSTPRKREDADLPPARIRRTRVEPLPWDDATAAADNAAMPTQAFAAPGETAHGETAQMTRKLGAKRADSQDAEPAAPSKRPSKRTSAKKKPEAASAPSPSSDFELPPMSLLKTSGKRRGGTDEASLRDTAMLLQDTLADFGVDANVVGWAAGPTVTLFKVSLPSGVRVSRVTNLTDDIALAMASPGVRIFSPVPGTNYVGIEVPNAKRSSVLLGDVLPKAGTGPLEVAVGEDVEGNPIVSNLAKMPHLLIGGTTGSGKSVSINAMIMSILMRATPAEVRFIMIDPKRVEFTPYNDIPHLYVPVVNECKEASSALAWAVAEMEKRLKIFADPKVAVRNISQYNAKAQALRAAAEETGEEPELKELPYIVIIIDELADLMMNVGKEVEFSIARLAQLARAAGIHMIIATQRPSANVVTGLIKANITNRIAFNVASGIDSRVILDTPGAENLIGWGDMLFVKPEYPKPQRLQGCFVDEDEIAAVVEHLKTQAEPEYHSEILQTNVITMGESMPDGSGGSSSADDPLLWEAAEIVVNTGLGSTSNIQRRLKVGYSRAGRIMDMLEEKGIVGPPNGSKPRDVLVDIMELETLKAFEQNDAATGD